MVEINIPRDQKNALKAIDTNELEQLVDRAIREERSGILGMFPLTRCGLHITTKLQDFEQALVTHKQAKARQKREKTGNALRRAGSDLTFAVGAMKRRMEMDEKEGELFYVDDQILSPYRFDERMSVTVSYRWRRTADHDWVFGSITFVHKASMRPNFTIPAPRRKPSVAKQEQDRQTKLCQMWEHLLRLALCSVRDYFKAGGDGDKIPDTFQATADHSRELDNYSANFWRTNT
jgi:hypothetical protein